MEHETINRVEILDTGELFLGLEGRGQPLYQYVYREAVGVYWDDDRIGFKSTPMQEESCLQWFKRIIDTVRSGLSIELKLKPKVVWVNVPERQKEEIQREAVIQGAR